MQAGETRIMVRGRRRNPVFTGGATFYENIFKREKKAEKGL